MINEERSLRRVRALLLICLERSQGSLGPISHRKYEAISSVHGVLVGVLARNFFQEGNCISISISTAARKVLFAMRQSSLAAGLHLEW
jgi:hypothetical protein